MLVDAVCQIVSSWSSLAGSIHLLGEVVVLREGCVGRRVWFVGVCHGVRRGQGLFVFLCCTLV